MNYRPAGGSAIVVGGGVIGLFTAWYLLEAGFSVTVLERERAGRSASWAAGGILSPLPPWQAPRPVWDLAAEGLRIYPALCEQLAALSGVDPQWTPSGMLVLDPPDAAEAVAWGRRQGIPVGSGTVEWEGQVRPAALLPWVAQVRSPRLLKALLASVVEKGARLRERSPVVSVQRHAGRISAIGTADGVLHAADCFVICAGAWSTQLLPELSWPRAIQPVRGQMILLQAQPGQCERIVLAGDRYLIPRRDGHIVVGSTLEPVGFDDSLTVAARDSLYAFATRLMPGLHGVPLVAHWAGLRPGSEEGIPLIERHAEYQNVWINAGHYRNGITLGPASAKRLVQQMTAI